MARKGNLLASIAAVRRARKTKSYRSVVIRTVLLDEAGKAVRDWQRVNPEPGKYFTSSGVDDVLTQAMAQCEEMYPGRVFKLIPLSDGSFSFIEQPRNPSWQPPSSQQSDESFHQIA